MSTATGLLRTVDGLLPAVPGEVTGVLHVAAFVGLAYVFRLGSVRFQGRNVELFGRRASSWEVLVGLAVVALLLATARWWAGPAFFLSGWQAFGLVSLEVGWLIQSAADGVDLAALAMAAAGLALFVVPWVA